jgi:hypothetical protein
VCVHHVFLISGQKILFDPKGRDEWSLGAACRKPEGKGDRTLPRWRAPVTRTGGGDRRTGPVQFGRPQFGAGLGPGRSPEPEGSARPGTLGVAAVAARTMKQLLQLPPVSSPTGRPQPGARRDRLRSAERQRGHRRRQRGDVPTHRTLTTLSTPSKSTRHGGHGVEFQGSTMDGEPCLRSDGLGHLPVAAAGCACIRRRFLCERPSPASAIGFCAGPVALAAQRSRVGPARHGRIQRFPTHCMASLEGDLACVEGAGCYCCMCPSRTRSI